MRLLPYLILLDVTSLAAKSNAGVQHTWAKSCEISPYEFISQELYGQSVDLVLVLFPSSQCSSAALAR